MLLWSFFVCYWFIHDLATLHSTWCIQQRLVESWTLTKRICLMMKPSSLVVHDDIFILNLVPPIVNYPKRFRFLRNLRSCCPKSWGSFDNDEINWPNHTVVLKIFHCLIIRMGAVYVQLGSWCGNPLKINWNHVWCCSVLFTRRV